MEAARGDATTDVAAPRDRLRSAITRVSHANTFAGRVRRVSHFVSSQMDVTVIGSEEAAQVRVPPNRTRAPTGCGSDVCAYRAAQRTARRELDPTVLGPGLGTMLSVHRASVVALLPAAPQHTLATGLLAADAQQRPPAIPEAGEAEARRPQQP